MNRDTGNHPFFFYSLFRKYGPSRIGFRALDKSKKPDFQVPEWSFNMNTLWERENSLQESEGKGRNSPNKQKGR